MNAYDELFLQAMNSEESNTSDELVQKGKVIAKIDKGYFIASTGKSELFLPESEVDGQIVVGDEISFVQTGYKDGVPQVSQKKSSHILLLSSLEESVENQSPMTAKVITLVQKDNNPVGYEVMLGTIKAFLPMSHVRGSKDAKALIGKELTVVVIKKERDRVVVSERIIREALQKNNFENFLSQYKEGDLVSVTVESVTPTYALVNNSEISMFMHITEFNWQYTKDLTEVIKEGDKFEVRIIQIDTAKRSVKVSRKAAIVNPIQVFFDNKKIGDDLTVQVIRFARGLAIVQDGDGAEMILPVAEMSWVNKVSDPRHLLNIGDRIEVRIKEMDREKGRIVVSLRDLLENLWSVANTKYAINTQHKGRISSITDFGIFLAFDDGIQGLLRTEDIDWNQENTNLNERFKKGDELVVMVMNIDSANEKLRLGLKQLSENPIQNFADAHPVGSIITSTVKTLQKDGVEVSLGEELVGFIHISQLSSERINDPKDICTEGQEVQAVVRRVNVSQQKIELSIRELQQAEEKQAFAEVMKDQEVEVPTLGSMFSDILKKK